MNCEIKKQDKYGCKVIYILISYMLYFPIVVMMILCFAEGILGVTSYNIRISATQSYVPDEKKGRSITDRSKNENIS